MTWNVRVVGAGRRRTLAYARGHRFEVGSPITFDSEDAAVSALEYALGALAADLVVTFDAQARRRRLEIDAVEAVVTGALNNPLTVLEVVGEDGNPGIERITLKLYVISAEPRERIEAALERARSLSPLTRTLAAALDLDIELAVTP